MYVHSPIEKQVRSQETAYGLMFSGTRRMGYNRATYAMRLAHILNLLQDYLLRDCIPVERVLFRVGIDDVEQKFPQISLNVECLPNTSVSLPEMSSMFVNRILDYLISSPYGLEGWGNVCCGTTRIFAMHGSSLPFNLYPLAMLNNSPMTARTMRMIREWTSYVARSQQGPVDTIRKRISQTCFKLQDGITVNFESTTEPGFVVFSRRCAVTF